MTGILTATWFTKSTGRALLMAVVCGVLLLPCVARSETYGIKDARGNFVPKVTVTIAQKEIVIKKSVPDEKFRTIALRLNAKNNDLIERVAELSVEWIDLRNRPHKPGPFAGKLYDRSKKEFKDSMERSAGLRITDKSKRSLFANKHLPELFTIYVDDQQLLSAEAAKEQRDTVPLGSGRDVSINVDKTVISFNEGNLRKGEWVTVENRTGFEQVLGIEMPRAGWEYYGVIRKPEQSKIPPENWDRFTVAAGAGVSIALVPDPDLSRLAQLDGKEIVVKRYQGGKASDVRRIPIEIATDLPGQAPGPSSSRQDPSAAPVGPVTKPATPGGQGIDNARDTPKTPNGRPTQPGTNLSKSDGSASFWLWVVQISNLVLLAALATYALFFALPRVQVLEDRMGKTEMFILGSREAIREELELMKREMCQQVQKEPGQE